MPKNKTNEETRLVSAQVDMETHRLIRMEAARMDLSISNYLRHILKNALVKKKK